jgi:hypothetical protein
MVSINLGSILKINMLDLYFGPHIFSVTVAVCLSYSLLMHLAKKDTSITFVRGISAMLLLTLGIALLTGFRLLLNPLLLNKLSIPPLLISLAISLTIVIYHRFIRQQTGAYDPVIKKWMMRAIVVMFGLSILELIALIGATGY